MVCLIKYTKMKKYRKIFKVVSNFWKEQTQNTGKETCWAGGGRSMLFGLNTEN